MTMGDDAENKTESESGEPREGGKKGGKTDRSAQAKAFYRAMYAGAEPDPEDFGLANKQEQERGPCPSCARMQAEMADLEKRTQEAENHWKRMAADFENYRKRVAREKEEFSAAGVQRAIEAILPALDDMDLAKTKLSANIDPASMMESLNMVYNRFNRCLEQIGIKQLEVIGEMFDPVYHEPVQQIPSNAVPDGAVLHQLRPGYTFNDKVLRPSLVNVATAVGEGDYVAEEASAVAEEGTAEVAEEGAGEEEVAAAEDVTEGSVAEEYAGESEEQPMPEEVVEDEAAYETAESTEEESAQTEDWAVEHAGAGNLTQDLPVIDVATALQPQEFEEKEQASASEES